MMSWKIRGICSEGKTPFIEVFTEQEAKEVINNLKSLGFNPFVIINN